MASEFQAVRGMNDILPDETPYWQHLEDTVRAALVAWGYEELRLPLVERTELFSRCIGEVTDIVEKEMYTFADRNGDSLTLRPEGTAGCARAAIEHGLLRAPRRLWYLGPMFRHERPQKGRYRQFHQIGAEAYGWDGPDIDAELILMTAGLWRALGIDGLRLELNSLGSPETRAGYRERLVQYLESHRASLDEDSRRRLSTNPLRILDSKNPEMQELIEAAPRLLDDLDPDSRRHLDGLGAMLEAAGLPYHLNPRLVRGLDYYTRTVFEWTTVQLGAQGTVCAGGRYDRLIEQLGGPPTPAVGFAMGLERLVHLLRAGTATPRDQSPHAYLVLLGAGPATQGPRLARDLRERLPDLRLLMGCGGGGLKGQLRRADRSGARVALILGEAEWEQGAIAVKDLRGESPQVHLRIGEAATALGRLLGL